MSDPIRPSWPRAAASAIVLRGREVLLMQRSKGAFTGLWSLPGGHIEPGETARAAAAREVMEETGVEAELAGVLDVHDVIARGADGALTAHYVISVYYGRWRSGEACAGSDSLASRFFDLGAIADLPMTEGTARYIVRAARLLGVASGGHDPAAESL